MDEEFVSKTQVKKEMTALQEMGVQLVDLPESQLDRIALNVTLKHAILEAKRITSHGARRRQMQYIGKLMRDVDPAPIRRQLEALNSGSAASAAMHKRLEAWREKLMADDGALTEFAAAYPGADLQQIRTLIRNAKKEKDTNKPPRAYRELFRLIKECSDSNRS
jgi:ribosome-associated protein